MGRRRTLLRPAATPGRQGHDDQAPAPPLTGLEPGTPAALDRWQGRSVEAVLARLEAELEPLIARLLQRLLATIPAYQHLPAETLQQVREVIQANLTCFIATARRGSPPTAEELARFQRYASQRAREGVPLTALLAAYHLGIQAHWERMRELLGSDAAAAGAGMDLATLLLGYAGTVTAAVAQAYLDEHERLAADREAVRRDFIEGIISGSLTRDEIQARSQALGLGPAPLWAVALVAADGGERPAEGLQDAQRQLAALLPAELAGGALAAVRGDQLVLVLPTAPGGEAALVGKLERLLGRVSAAVRHDLRCGLGRAHESLAELPASYREASVALAAARRAERGTVAVYGQVLIEELLIREPGVACRLSRAVLQPLENSPDLLGTLREYLRSGPSLPTVAKRLCVHPNTVAYRLARVHRLTGRDPRTAAGLAELYVALRAADLLGEVDGTRHGRSAPAERRAR